MVSWLLGVMLVWSVVYERRAFATGIKGHEEQFRCNGPAKLPPTTYLYQSSASSKTPSQPTHRAAMDAERAS